MSYRLIRKLLLIIHCLYRNRNETWISNAASLLCTHSVCNNENTRDFSHVTIVTITIIAFKIPYINRFQLHIQIDRSFQVHDQIFSICFQSIPFNWYFSVYLIHHCMSIFLNTIITIITDSSLFITIGYYKWYRNWFLIDL